MAKYMTRQRAVLTEFLSRHPDESFSAAQIAEALQAQDVSLSAVYRNLGELETQGVVCRTSREGGREALYRYTQSEGCRRHLHMSCTRCGRTFHMDLPTTDSLVEQVAEDTDFQVDRASTVLHGICGGCIKADDSQEAL